MIKATTIVEGVEFKQYDTLLELLTTIEDYFIAEEEYVGLPNSPMLIKEAEGLFQNSVSDIEKEWLYIQCVIKLIHCYQRWAVDKDMLWKDEDIEKHEEDIKTYKMLGIWKKDKRNWAKYM